MTTRVIVKILIVCISISSCAERSATSFDQKLVRNSLERAESLSDSLPEARGIITDIEDILTEEEEVALFKTLSLYEEKTSREIAILTTPSFLDYDDPLLFATDVGNYWRLGKADKNNGLLIVVSKTQKQTAISSGYGTEREVSNLFLDSIIQNVMIPDFKKERYYLGISTAVRDITRAWDKELP